MRDIKFINVHCTATSQSATVESLSNYWRNVKKWRHPGYHYVILPDGQIHQFLSEEAISNGVKGVNSVSVNIAYIGGIDSKKKAIDNRTKQQLASMRAILIYLQESYPDADIKGHRDHSPDLNGDGEISSDEFIKQCPSFDVTEWLSSINFYAQLNF